MFDRIIVSTNDDEVFRQFIPVVSRAWKKFFPECSLHIAYVTDRDEDDSQVIKLKRYGDVHLFKPIEGIPTPNHAKVSRHILASKFEKSVCMLEDVDTVPLQRVYYQDRTDKRENGHLLAVGAEVLNGTLDEGKFPMSTITAEGYTFKKFINPHDLDDESLVKSWIDLKITNHGVEHARGGWMEHSQAINNPPGRYSDESMIWALLTQWSDKNITHVHRAVDINSDWIDRDWWNIDTGKLLYGRYIACNFLRPIWRLNMADFNQIKPIIGYIYDDESFEDIFVTELQEGF